MQTVVPSAVPAKIIGPPPVRGRVPLQRNWRAGRLKTNTPNQQPDGDDFTARLVVVGTDANLDAFEALFRHFGPKIRAFMMKRSADRQLAEELMQETMMTVWNKAAQFDPARGSASSWIFTIARNVRVDAYRKSNRPEFDPNDPAFVPDAPMPADTMMELGQDAERLHAAMANLPDEQVELLKLSFFEEASHSAIAETLGLPIGTVKSRIRLAFSKLRDALGERT